ncbi:hypothetical protein [uncultured Ellagibacter sp.]|uniref:hypothetical protein n=1 Tax=uncultured Ellagibacter sp. TaxID=2137580 RepID=UPI0026086D39|nr:hypothetical protein [uncultured Ellagibacter sp.]
MAEYNETVLNLAKSCVSDHETLKKIAEALSSGTRRSRQQAAQVLSAVSISDASAIAPFNQILIDALNRPEAQTRWECLDALTRLCDVDASLCSDAIDGAENALFDEESGPLHLAAMRFLCKFGAVSEQNSERVWPLVDEGIQCWHGDLEFQDMLNSLVEFSTGHLSDSVKSELAERMLFDSKNGRGALKRKATTIVENLS